MTRSVFTEAHKLFTEAHKLAKTYEGDYRACFALALQTLRDQKKQNIKKINVWKSNKGEYRVYVSFSDRSEQGCYYLNGNDYQEKGTISGMTKKELKNAFAISESIHGAGKWGCVYENQISLTDVHQSKTKSSFEIAIQEARRDARRGFPVNLDDYIFS